MSWLWKKPFPPANWGGGAWLKLVVSSWFRFKPARRGVTPQKTTPCWATLGVSQTCLSVVPLKPSEKGALCLETGPFFWAGWSSAIKLIHKTESGREIRQVVFPQLLSHLRLYIMTCRSTLVTCIHDRNTTLQHDLAMKKRRSKYQPAKPVEDHPKSTSWS